MNNSNIDWATKKSQGRVKDIGVPWSEEELVLLKEGKTPDELRDVHSSTSRAGSSKTTAPAAPVEKPLKNWLKKDLQAKAKELDLNLPEDATNPELVAAIEEAIKNPKGPADAGSEGNK